jgi:hypothetical protein
MPGRDGRAEDDRAHTRSRHAEGGRRRLRRSSFARASNCRSGPARMTESQGACSRSSVNRAARKRLNQFTAIDDCARILVLKVYDARDQRMATQFVDQVLRRFIVFPVAVSPVTMKADFSVNWPRSVTLPVASI